MGSFPIDSLLQSLRRGLTPGACVLLQAPPGAGKTSRVPLALLGHWPEIAALDGTVLMLEPRRLATKAAASRLAEQLQEPLGERVGYSVRHESKRSRQTRLEVLTAGLFLRRLQADPELKGISCVIFDEFHERGRDNDLALALVRDTQTLLRPDLALLLMSATLDLSDLKARLPNAEVLTSEGQAFPVSTSHLPPRPDEPLSRTVLRAMEIHGLALLDQVTLSRSATPPPTVLIFLPGLREIERCHAQLSSASSLSQWEICSLHGQQALATQAQVLSPCRPDVQGRIVLATAIAESSLTIDGVRLVIDSGLSRHSRYSPGTGMEGLVTVPSSLASADQRRGRAGRQGPGQCVRLWSPAEQQRRPTQDPPELLRCDPQPLVLDLAMWGAGLGDELAWLDPPPLASLQAGQQALQTLGALTSSGLPSPMGRQLAQLGTHPRLALILAQARAWGCSRLGAHLAALLSERDPLNRRDHGVDLGARLSCLEHRGGGERFKTIRHLSQQLERQLQQLPALPEETLPGWSDPPGPQEDSVTIAARLIATAFPEWLALQRNEQPGRYQLRQGRGAQLPEGDPLTGSEALAVARLDLGERNGRIQLALALPKPWLQAQAELEGVWHTRVVWDEASSSVRARRTLWLGSLNLQSVAQPKPPAAEACQVLLEQVRNQGLDLLPWSERVEQLRARLQMLHCRQGPPWPARNLEQLRLAPEAWLQGALLGCMGWRDVREEGLIEALWGDLDWRERQRVDQLLPQRIAIPSGRNARLRYSDQEVVLAVKLQEMFGCVQGPFVLGGSVPVTLELLSPAGRPLQRTQDLAGFWTGSYRDIRREMRGRYPKHPWPEDPRTCQATAKTNHRLHIEAKTPKR
ncbi:MAG: ATP-dependent helicase HrpB [Synechococcus sp.]